MEKSLKIAKEYEERARRSVSEARHHLKEGFLETSVSTVYYACFYAVQAQMAKLGIEISSHKQAGIEFRRYFIGTKKLPSTFSATWQSLFDWRMEVDYDPVPGINREKAKELVALGEDFVKNLLQSD